MPKLDDLYAIACREGNMGPNGPRLRDLAAQCKYITEFGTREGHSAACSLVTKPNRFITYDIQHVNGVPGMLEQHGAIVRTQNVWDAACVIEKTDMLFTDTVHDYRYLKHELLKHGPSVNSYIVIHDTEAAAEFREGFSGGLRYAIEEFLWLGTFKLVAHYPEDRGMTVLARI